MPSDIAQEGDIPTNISELENDTGYVTESGVTTIVDGVVTTDYVNALGISVDAANITGVLEANQINMTGAITWNDFSQDVIDEINDAGMTEEEVLNLIQANVDAGMTEDEVIDLINTYGYDAPSYIKSTYIDFSTVESPKIVGNEIITTGHFAVSGDVGGLSGYMGYLGAAYGLDASENTTYGVALSYGNPSSLQSGDKYVIVTNGGVRMQAGSNRVTVTSGGIYLQTENGGAYYNGTEINTGGSGGEVTAVWG